MPDARGQIRETKLINEDELLELAFAIDRTSFVVRWRGMNNLVPTSVSSAIATTTTIPSEPLAELFNGMLIRIVMIGNAPWFVLPDVCSALGMEKCSARGILNSRASKTCENMGVFQIPPSQSVTLPDSLGRMQQTKLISRDDVLALTFAGKSELAEKFREWVIIVVGRLADTGTVQLAPPAPAPVLSEAEKVLEAFEILRSQVATERARADAERAAKEEAIRTKSHISAGREAQMMGRVGGLTRALNTKERQVTTLTGEVKRLSDVVEVKSSECEALQSALDNATVRIVDANDNAHYRSISHMARVHRCYFDDAVPLLTQRGNELGLPAKFSGGKCIYHLRAWQDVFGVLPECTSECRCPGREMWRKQQELF